MDYFLLTYNLTKATGKLDNLTDGAYFCDSLPITSWNINLPALTNGSHMFQNCSTLMNFTSDLSTLTNGSLMFELCASLTSFTGGLPVLTNGHGMFSHCTSLTSFSGALPKMTNGAYMFDKCKLNLASVQNIADTINDLAAQNKTGKITIGMQKAIQGNEELATALATIRNKGWTVTEQYN